MTESATTVNKDIIDGSAVISRETARIFTPLSKYPDGLSPTYGVDMCVLDDARVVYQCVQPDAPTCEYWHENGVSVRSHLRSHKVEGEKQEKRELQARIAEFEQREAQRKENFRNGALRGAQKRRENRAARENGTYIDQSTSDNENGQTTMTDKQRKQKIDNAQTSLEGVAEGLGKVRTVIDNMTKTLNNVVDTLEELHSSAPAVDPVLADKAARWDALQGLIGTDGRKTR